MATTPVFSDEQIASILSLINTTRHTQYIGARYVPIFGRKGETSIEWDNSGPYEPLTIVLYQGNSYTSRQFVPAGIDVHNGDFWANTGNYNAQIEQYRQTVENYKTATDQTIQQYKTDTDQTIQQYKNDTDQTIQQYKDDTDQTIQQYTGAITSNTTAINNLTPIVAKNSSKLQNIYNIKDYGASEESDNNSPAIQAAIDAAYANGGGIVFVPLGTWNVKRETNTVWFGAKCAIKLFDNVSLMGESMEKSVLRVNDPEGDGCIISGTQQLNNCRIAYLRLEMQHLTARASIGEKCIYSQNLINCSIDHIHANGSNGTGIGVDLLQNVWITDNLVTHCGRGWVVGHHLGCSGIGIGAGTMGDNPLSEMSVVSNNIVLDSGQFGIFYEHQGLNVATEQPTDFSGTRYAEVIIANNILRDTTYKGIGVVALQGVQIKDNVIHRAPYAAIEISKWCSDISISGNVAINCTQGITIGVDKERDVAQGPKWTLNNIYVHDNDLRITTPGITINANLTQSRVYGNTVFCGVSGAVAYAVTGVDASNKITVTDFFASENVSPSRTVTRDVNWVNSPNSQNQFNSSN